MYEETASLECTSKSIEQHIGEQYLMLPHSICTPKGAPHKDKKS